jgi:hypothetical protein
MAPPDHTGRTNKFAHHLLLRAEECVPAGPSWLLQQPGVVADSWTGEPRELPQEKQLPNGGRVDAGVCASWHRAGGDAGWAGVLANAAMLDPSKACSVIVNPGTNTLALITEAMLLLPAELRWRVTFTSYFMEPIAGVRCVWRFCLDGTPAAAAARASGGTCIDISTRAQCTRTGRFIEFARTGVMPTLKTQISSNYSEGQGAVSTEYQLMPDTEVGEVAVARPHAVPIRSNTFERKEIATTEVQRWSNSAAVTVVGVVIVLVGIVMYQFSAGSKELEAEKAKVADLKKELEAEKAKVADLKKELEAEMPKVEERDNELAAERAKVEERDNEVVERDNGLAVERAKVAEPHKESGEKKAKDISDPPPMPTCMKDWKLVELQIPKRTSGVQQNWVGGETTLCDSDKVKVQKWFWSPSKESNTLDFNNDKEIRKKGGTKPDPIAVLNTTEEGYLQLKWTLRANIDKSQIEGYKTNIETKGLCVRRENSELEWIRFSKWKSAEVSVNQPATIKIETSVSCDFQFAFEGGKWEVWNAGAEPTHKHIIPQDAGFIIFELPPNSCSKGQGQAQGVSNQNGQQGSSQSSGQTSPMGAGSGGQSQPGGSGGQGGRSREGGTGLTLTVRYEWPDHLSDDTLKRVGSETDPKQREERQRLEQERTEVAKRASMQKLLFGLTTDVPTHQLDLKIVSSPPKAGGGN